MTIIAQEIEARMPRSRIVEIVDVAEPALRPLSPKAAVALAFFLVGALSSLCGLVLLLWSRGVCVAVQPT